jgi:mannose-6-phosphate isomerase-like protein (cupin superfamily)
MRRAILIASAIFLTLSPVPGFSQTVSSKPAVDITNADIATVMSAKEGGIDRQIKIVDLGKYNMGVAIIHRGPTKDKPGDPVQGILHEFVTETYIIKSGSGILTTGGTAPDLKKSAPAPPGSENAILVGPGASGTIKDGVSRKVGPGDVIIIPAGVLHGWSQIPNEVTYLSVRPDADKVLPAGYVNPALKTTAK